VVSVVKKAGWRRPRNRVYPAKPELGIRAKARGELLHLDVTIIRLLDGTRAYLHAVIDNYSRRILSWTLEERLGSGGTCRILREAIVQLNDCLEHVVVVRVELVIVGVGGINFYARTPAEAYATVDVDALLLSDACRHRRGPRLVSAGSGNSK
jgi:hypothetical protein